MQGKRVSALLEAVDHFKADGDLSATHAPMSFLDSEQKAALKIPTKTGGAKIQKILPDQINARKSVVDLIPLC
jgi:hypothetical protein